MRAALLRAGLAPSPRAARVLAVAAVAAWAVVGVLRAAPGMEDAEALSAARRASDRFVEAQAFLHAERDAAVSPEARAELRRNDPRGSGLVGVEWSRLASSPGRLEAKQASTDPRWPALFVRWYRDAGLRPGDRVAIGASGSFPALALASRLAAEEMRLRPVVAASLTASNFGATVESFDFLDIERALVDSRRVARPFDLLTPGAGGDRAEGPEPLDQGFVLARIESLRRDAERLGIRVLVPEPGADPVEPRAALLLDPAPGLFVNIGGHAANQGSGSAALELPRGLTMPGDAGAVLDAIGGVDSVARRALSSGVPVLHVLAVRPLMTEQGLEPGASIEDLFTRPAPWARACALAAAALLLGALWRMGLAARLPPPYDPSQSPIPTLETTP